MYPLRAMKGIFLGMVTGLAILTAVLLAYSYLGQGLRAEGSVTVVVNRGDTLADVATRLSSEGWLKNPTALVVLGVLRGDATRIKPGHYKLRGGISPARLLSALTAGEVATVALTVPEGFSLADIAQRVEERGLGTARRFLTLSHDPAFIAQLNLPFRENPPSLEGVLYPETYFFGPATREAKVISTMAGEFKARVGEDLRKLAPVTGMSAYEILTLASIVEKETGQGSERPLIAAVFLNRLRKKMRLESDPTVIYGVKNFDGNLTRTHLRTVTPFNTYRVRGLPPTPIASPGLASIQAVFQPAKVDYLYFVSKGDGTHVFSLDFQTHKKAVQKYQVRRQRTPSKS